MVDADGGRIPLESYAELYRKPDENNRIVVETSGTVRPLGVADATVSRKKNGQAPVSLAPKSEFVEIRNDGNTNGVTVTTGGEEFDVEQGFVETVARDATISVGYRTTLTLTVEREATVEQNVVHQGEGDVVVGDQTNVDRSTTVGDDNVVNRSSIGGSEGHDGRRASGSSTESSTGGGPTYCTDCGTKLTGPGGVCPECDRGATRRTRSNSVSATNALTRAIPAPNVDSPAFDPRDDGG
ncbi:hypothetical protein ACFQL0_11370 [Haloplanus litoreus]|uniref:hypothetical protein n=1 Tax=Haloplanus litoreus TaxID=767515 RepID=UPI00360FA6FF